MIQTDRPPWPFPGIVGELPKDKVTEPFDKAKCSECGKLPHKIGCGMWSKYCGESE